MSDEPLVKYGVLTSESKEDFDLNKKAEYVDEDGLQMASEENKHLLKNPKKLWESEQKDEK